LLIGRTTHRATTVAGQVIVALAPLKSGPQNRLSFAELLRIGRMPAAEIEPRRSECVAKRMVKIGQPDNLRHDQGRRCICSSAAVSSAVITMSTCKLILLIGMTASATPIAAAAWPRSAR